MRWVPGFFLSVVVRPPPLPTRIKFIELLAFFFPLFPAQPGQPLQPLSQLGFKHPGPTILPFLAGNSCVRAFPFPWSFLQPLSSFLDSTAVGLTVDIALPPFESDELPPPGYGLPLVSQ